MIERADRFRNADRSESRERLNRKEVDMKSRRAEAVNSYSGERNE